MHSTGAAEANSETRSPRSAAFSHHPAWPRSIDLGPASADEWRSWLLAHACGGANDEALASMLASQQIGQGALPDRLGLDPADYAALINNHFPCLVPSPLRQPRRTADPGRADERNELVQLLLKDAESPSESRRWFAHIVATGCMGSDHLWQDLGLWNRRELSRLMEQNFPEVAARNLKDMKWKRFLYKQLCEAEGIYTCRAPSCEVCVDYHACFGPEN
jgi:nitrogen fixation protein NifQ